MENFVDAIAAFERTLITPSRFDDFLKGDSAALTFPYMHDGTVETLEEAVEVMMTCQVGRKITSAQTEAMVAFLNALTGEELQ